MKVVFAERARQDIADIYDSIAGKSPVAAQRVEDAIRLACVRLPEFPYASPATDEPGVFRRPLVKYPYAIFYRVLPDRDAVEIARVIHGARVKDLHTLPEDE